jgi:hypothetical protein
MKIKFDSFDNLSDMLKVIDAFGYTSCLIQNSKTFIPLPTSDEKRAWTCYAKRKNKSADRNVSSEIYDYKSSGVCTVPEWEVMEIINIIFDSIFE